MLASVRHHLKVAIAAAALAGCTGKGTTPPTGGDHAVHDDALAAAQPADAAFQEDPMTITSAADITAHDGQVVTATGRYEIEDMGRYRYTSELPDGTKLTSSLVVYLKLDDETDIRLGARPDAERAKFANQRVQVRGTMLANPPRQPEHVAQMDPMPTLLKIEQVTAAP